MKRRISIQCLFTAIFMLITLLQRCSSDDSPYQRVLTLEGWRIEMPDTIVFTEIEQTIHIPYRVLDDKCLEVQGTNLSIYTASDTYSCLDGNMTIHYCCFENKDINKTFRAYSYLKEGTVYKDVYIAFRPDMSKSTPTHPYLLVEEPGTLESLIDPSMEKEITGLTLYGMLNTVDQIYLRKLLGAPEAFAAWSEEVGMDVLDPDRVFVILPNDQEFFAKVESEYKLSYLDLSNVVYKSVNDPEDAFFFMGYKVTDIFVKPMNIVRYLFLCCVNLEEIYLPKWNEGINSCIFNMCGRLHTVHYPDKLVEYAREITEAEHFDDFLMCTRIQNFDLGENTTNYKVDESGDLWQVDCNGLLITSKNPNRTRYDVPVGATLFCRSIGDYPALRDIYIHETFPKVYNSFKDLGGCIISLINSDMYDDVTFHLPEGYMDTFKSRHENSPWAVVTLVDDVKDFHVTEDYPTKSVDLRAAETEREPQRYRFLLPNE